MLNHVNKLHQVADIYLYNMTIVNIISNFTIENIIQPVRLCSAINSLFFISSSGEYVEIFN